MPSASVHKSILTKEILEYLSPRSGGVYLDATFGGGGHTQAILEASAPSGRVVGVDRDPAAERFAKQLEKDYKSRFQFVNNSYENVWQLGVQFDGAVMDLGISSDQLGSDGRGFSFQKDEPLDLRFDPRSGQTAAQFLQQAPLSKLEQVFRDYAEDRYWRVLARKIIERRGKRPIHTQADLLECIGGDNPKVLAPIWQALRIVVNDELGHLERGLRSVAQVLKDDGALVVLSFHSLEDRIVKNFLRSGDFKVLTKKPIVPSDEEVASNPRSRSAKLRAGRKLPADTIA